MLLLALISLEKKRYAMLLILSLVGILAKESALLIIPVGMAYIFWNDQKNKLLMFALFSILLFAVFISIRIFIPIGQGISFTQAFLENWTKLFSFEAMAKQFFLAFNPFFLIPLFTYKDFFSFNKKNIHWFVLLVFIAFMFQKLEERRQIKLYVLISVLFLCWIANLHHIWGIVKLPTREMSLAFALLGGFITLLIYLKLKNERKVII